MNIYADTMCFDCEEVPAWEDSIRCEACNDAEREERRQANAASHHIGNIDDVARCIDCEIAAWNAWKEPCIK